MLVKRDGATEQFYRISYPKVRIWEVILRTAGRDHGGARYSLVLGLSPDHANLVRNDGTALRVRSEADSHNRGKEQSRLVGRAHLDE